MGRIRSYGWGQRSQHTSKHLLFSSSTENDINYCLISYHMQYYHGISATSGLPLSPPLKFRLTNRPGHGKIERSKWVEGLCHSCSKWVPCDGVKDVETKVPEIFWWKHAAACHRGNNIVGEGDWYIVDDDVAKEIRERERTNAGLEGDNMESYLKAIGIA